MVDESPENNRQVQADPGPPRPPPGPPEFVAAQTAPVEADDMVMTVALSGEQRAYPVRTIGYHHIVNDRLGRVAIVATY